MLEKNYDFRARRWAVHTPDRRDFSRTASPAEILLDESWCIGCPADASDTVFNAADDFQDYLQVSMGLSLPVIHENRPCTLWLSENASIEKGYTLDVSESAVLLTGKSGADVFRGIVALEDLMNAAFAPVLTLGHTEKAPLYEFRSVHSGCAIDVYPDEELRAAVHAGYDCVVLFLVDFDHCRVGKLDVNDVIRRAARFGLRVFLFNYIKSFRHPSDPDAEEYFDSIYGELFRRYPDAIGIMLCGESLEFPSRDPHTTGKTHRESVTDGIPDTRPSPGWYPCSDYPDYLACIERAIHRVKPDAIVEFSTYNWGYTPLELRRNFLEHLKGGITLSVCFEIFSKRTLEGLRTPVMDYTCSARTPGYYFETETAAAHELGIPAVANCNTAGVAWDFGVVPYVPAPHHWYDRSFHLREAALEGRIIAQYATHHYGFWDCVASDIGKALSVAGDVPDCDTVLQRSALTRYGADAAPYVLKAWECWDKAMDHYIASNEDQYGPWRVGAAYPFIFLPNITRTMRGKEIRFPADPNAHFGAGIIKTLYQPYENENQAPAFLRYPAELRSLEKMLAYWNEGLEAAQEALKAADDAHRAEAARLEALGHFIRCSVRTVIHIKHWWLANMRLQIAGSQEEALGLLDEIVAIAHEEMENTRDAIPAVETDSRIGWEPSMEYVADKWHLEWKLRQVESALREISAYREIVVNARA